MAEEKEQGQRIAKLIASTGVCSRRDAEKAILDGRVKINGEVLKTPAFVVDSSDKILFDDKVLPRESSARLWLYYKPTGLITSHNDPQGRPTVFDNLPSNLPRVVSVGRLDLNSEGLLLLTNNGALSRHLEMPSTGWKRQYKVRALGRLSEDALVQLREGITIAGISYQGIEVIRERGERSNVWYSVTLSEGKNREIRKLFEHFDVRVNRLIRTAYGPFELGKIKRGEVKPVSLRDLKAALDKKLWRKFGLLNEQDKSGNSPKQNTRGSSKNRSHIKSEASENRSTAAKDKKRKNRPKSASHRKPTRGSKSSPLTKDA